MEHSACARGGAAQREYTLRLPRSPSALGESEATSGTGPGLRDGPVGAMIGVGATRAQARTARP